MSDGASVDHGNCRAAVPAGRPSTEAACGRIDKAGSQLLNRQSPTVLRDDFSSVLELETGRVCLSQESGQLLGVAQERLQTVLQMLEVLDDADSRTHAGF